MKQCLGVCFGVCLVLWIVHNLGYEMEKWLGPHLEFLRDMWLLEERLKFLMEMQLGVHWGDLRKTIDEGNLRQK